MSVRKVVAVGSIAALGLVAGLLPAPPALAGSPDELSECDQIREWIAANMDVLPRTYDQIGEYPLPYRKAIFNKLTPQEKSELWKAHMAEYLGTATHLNDEQSALIREAIRLMAPGLFAKTKKESYRRLHLESEVLRKRAQSLFDHSTQKEIFGQLGPAETKRILIAKTPACSCNNSDDWCPDGTGCDETANCADVQDACGWFWTKLCNGLCVDPSMVN